MAVDFEDIERINKLAKLLKDRGLAPSMPDAVKMAEEMIEKGEEALAAEIAKSEAQREKIAAPMKEEPITKEEGILEKIKEKTEEIMKNVVKGKTKKGEAK